MEFSRRFGVTGLDPNKVRLVIARCLKNRSASTLLSGASAVERAGDTMQAIDVVPLLSDDVLETSEKVLANEPEPPEFP